MIYGIGVDLVRISRMDRTVARWGERFVRRIFTGQEVEMCYRRQSPASGFALRFAAKEAFSKALGLGMKRGLKWRDMEVYHFPSGKPGIRVYGNADKICHGMGVSAIHLSLSDEGDYGIAMVVIETEK